MAQHHDNHHVSSENTSKKYPLRDWLPLFIVFGFVGILTITSMELTSFTIRDGLSYVMGYFFLLFSLFKILDLKGFASGYHEYDLISRKWYGWGYIAPFIELALGILYVIRIENVALHLFTLLFSIIICLGVSQKLAKKEVIHCVCLGNILKVPLTTISFAEYFIMAVMAVFMVLVPARASTQEIRHPHDPSIFTSYTYQSGEAYDRMFLHEMIDHHQGAVDMADLVKERAAHTELINFAGKIDTDQRAEIGSMKSWQQAWHYEPSAHEHQMNHMHMDMQMMHDDLQPLKGDAFDKRFLELMIEHHQSAVDMSLSGPTNALHPELRELTKSIIIAQTREIAQMHAWQHDWGFKE